MQDFILLLSIAKTCGFNSKFSQFYEICVLIWLCALLICSRFPQSNSNRGIWRTILSWGEEMMGVDAISTKATISPSPNPQSVSQSVAHQSPIPAFPRRLLVIWHKSTRKVKIRDRRIFVLLLLGAARVIRWNSLRGVSIIRINDIII